MHVQKIFVPGAGLRNPPKVLKGEGEGEGGGGGGGGKNDARLRIILLTGSTL